MHSLHLELRRISLQTSQVRRAAGLVVGVSASMQALLEPCSPPEPPGEADRRVWRAVSFRAGTGHPLGVGLAASAVQQARGFETGSPASALMSQLRLRYGEVAK